MGPERWQQIDRVFEAALERPDAGRPAFVASECAGDAEMLAEVNSLLAAHEQHDGFLEQSRRRDGLSVISDHHAMSLIESIVGNYRIRSRLGSGAASEVYFGEDLRLGRPVAIKFLARPWTADEDNVRRFRREALAASALNHPNILTIYEIGKWQDRDFIVAEYVDGVTLRQYLRSQRPSLDSSLEIAFQLANALAAAHSAGIVHRDIKPENVMVRTDGLIKVLDFGIAKQASPRGAAASDPDTANGVVIGTAPYMSPEQARGEPVDHRTDIWSLGVVLYEMLAGRLPFPGDTPADHIAAILGREPESLGKVRRDLPSGLEALVGRMLAKNRNERYSDAAALAKHLGQLRTDVKNPSWFVFPSRNRLIGGFLALVLATSAALWEVRHLRPPDGAGAVSRTLGQDQILSLAVLPLLNAGGRPDTEYLADGITDSLIDDLSAIPELKVMSRNSVFRYKGQIVDARQVGETLGVRAVISGRLVLIEDTVSVSVELVDTRNHQHIWGEEYHRKLANIFSLPQDMAREITQALRLRLSTDNAIRMHRLHTTNPEAYKLYLQGLFYWVKETPADFRKSCAYFERAVNADPNYALAYSGVGNYYGFASAHGLMNPDEGWPKAEAAINKALELDPGLSDARHGLAALRWIYRRDVAGAEKEFLHAIQVNANDAEARNHYSGFLVALGRFDEAIAQSGVAIECDPLSTRFITNLGRAYYYARRYDAAIRQYRLALELDSKSRPVHELLAEVYARSGTERAAVTEWQTALVLAGGSAAADALGNSYMKNGFSAALRTLGQHELERCTRRTEHGEFVPAADYARAYIRLGNADLALQWLAKADSERNRFASLIKVDPFYDILRRDPRFNVIAESAVMRH
jgi:eukaryotic-like serine/threonine-protein kinase